MVSRFKIEGFVLKSTILVWMNLKWVEKSIKHWGGTGNERTLACKWQSGSESTQGNYRKVKFLEFLKV